MANLVVVPCRKKGGIDRHTNTHTQTHTQRLQHIVDDSIVQLVQYAKADSTEKLYSRTALVKLIAQKNDTTLVYVFRCMHD